MGSVDQGCGAPGKREGKPRLPPPQARNMLATFYHFNTMQEVRPKEASQFKRSKRCPRRSGFYLFTTLRLDSFSTVWFVTTQSEIF